jgi:hypothetical protein
MRKSGLILYLYGGTYRTGRCKYWESVCTEYSSDHHDSFEEAFLRLGLLCETLRTRTRCLYQPQHTPILDGSIFLGFRQPWRATFAAAAVKVVPAYRGGWQGEGSVIVVAGPPEIISKASSGVLGRFPSTGGGVVFFLSVLFFFFA